MEETLQQEKQESESKNWNEDQGGIRRRLRDRDLLRKRKAEAEEKETNQWVFGVESQRKRPRAEDKGGAKKKGRPRKTEPAPQISVIQEEAAVPQEAPAVVVVPEPAEVTPDQKLGSLSTALSVESQPASVPAAPAAPAMVFGSVQRPSFAPSLTPQAPAVNLTPALFSPSVPPPAPSKDFDAAPVPVQDVAPVPDVVSVPELDQTPVPAAAPPQVENFSVGMEDRKALDQVFIEDLGPDEEEDVTLSQEKAADEDASEPPSISVPEENKIFSVPTLSSPPPPQEYLPGNSF